LGDFGFASVVDDTELLMQQHGTPGYVAPEILLNLPHGKPGDLWAVGVVVYFILCGYLPFDRDSLKEEQDAVMASEFSFHSEYWLNISGEAKEFIQLLLMVIPKNRLTAHQALKHPWITRCSSEERLKNDDDEERTSSEDNIAITVKS